MATSLLTAQPSLPPPGSRTDLSRIETRERLSASALTGFFAIAQSWSLSMDQASELLGNVPRSSLYKMLKTAVTLSQDTLTRISLVVGIYEALESLLPAAQASRWMISPNDNYLFAGHPPLRYAIQEGIPGLIQIRSLLDSALGGR